MNMKIAKLTMDSSDKTRFEIMGKSSVKYHLKANHEIEAKRWFWALNNAIQFTKDEAREEQRKISREGDASRQAIADLRTKGEGQEARKGHSVAGEARLGDKGLVASTAVAASIGNISRSSFQGTTIAPTSITGDDQASGYGSYDASIAGNDLSKISTGTAIVPGDVDDDEEYGDDASSHELRPQPKDAFTITAHSADLQLDILFHVSTALQTQVETRPDTTIGSPDVAQAISTYLSAVQSLKDMVSNLQRITKDRDAYWQYRLDREVDMRRMWEESMAKVVEEQEQLEGRIGESEQKRKRTKRALREALGETEPLSQPGSAGLASPDSKQPALAAKEDEISPLPAVGIKRRETRTPSGLRRKSTIATMTDLSDSDSDLDEEFFDAVGAGVVEIAEMPTSTPATIPSPSAAEKSPVEDSQKQAVSGALSASSFAGYEGPIRERLKMDADNRPKISLWVRA